MGILDGKTAVVTGAARGIGSAIAAELAGAGADLALCDLNSDWLSETAGIVEKAGRRAKCVGVDVSHAGAVADAVSDICGDLGKIDILVNNAGITKDTFLVRMSEEDWDAVISVNLKGAFLFTKAVARPMMKQKAGNIVNIASIIGLIGNAGQCNYAASKAGVIALTKSAAKELASRNIRVNAVAPGFIRTKMTEALSEDIQKAMLGAIPMKRFGEPSDVAKTVLFLVSEASSYMTGQVLTVSGGMVM
jgi:3-oxoacyl-[acyl-carrier protein] reductase